MSIEDTIAASLDSASPTETIRPNMEQTIAAISQSLKKVALVSSADFEKLRTLGEGGMGRVELARQRSLPREVALKSVKPGRRSEETEGALLVEAFFTGSLEHPNIVPIHAIERDEDGGPVIVMKKVDGVSWRELIRNESHPLLGPGDKLTRHVEILMQVCNAVHFAHSRGIAHRDIKPENVMVGAFGEVYLVDWGIAIRLSERELSPGFAGTPSFMAPEMLAGGIKTTAQSDIFLLGASLYEVLAGHPPFEGASLKEVVLAIEKASPRTPNAPEELVHICQRAMRKDSSERYESADQLKEALKLFLQHQGSRKLTKEARALIDESTTNKDPLALRQLFIESHFSLQQALREWSENTAAREMLDECLLGWISLEIQEKNPGTAEALLQNLSTPRPELKIQIDALKEKLTEQEGAKEKLESIERERDTSGSRSMFTAFSLIGMLSAAGGAVYVVLRPQSGVIPDDVPQLFYSSVGLFALVLSVTLWKRKILFQNEISRQTIIAFMGFALCFILHRLLNFLLIRPLEQALTEEIMMIACFCAALGAYLYRWFFAIAAILLVAAFVSALYPSTAGAMISLASALPFVGMIAAWRQRPKPIIVTSTNGSVPS